MPSASNISSKSIAVLIGHVNNRPHSHLQIENSINCPHPSGSMKSLIGENVGHSDRHIPYYCC